MSKVTEAIKGSIALGGATGAMVIRAELPKEYALRVSKVCTVYAMTPDEFISGACLTFLKSMEESSTSEGVLKKLGTVNATSSKGVTHATASKKKTQRTKAKQKDVVVIEDTKPKPKRARKPSPKPLPKRSPKPSGKVGWPKGKPRGKKVKPGTVVMTSQPQASWDPFSKFASKVRGIVWPKTST